MGQAKRRGTFDQRKAIAIEKATIEYETRIQKERKILANMTNEERQNKRRRELIMQQLLSYYAALGIPSYKI